MKIKGLIVVSVTAALILSSCVNSSIKNARVETKLDSLSYAFGIYNYNGLKQDSIDLDPIIIAKAMIEGKEGKPLMNETIARGYIYAFFNVRERQKREKEIEKNKILYKDIIAKGDSFLQKNKEKPGVTVTASGLQYEVIKMGTGPKPTLKNQVKVRYKGTLIDGTQFDASDPKKPRQFPVTGVIKGWTEALQLMPVGSIFKLTVPHNLAYGPEARGNIIKPYSILIFEIELLEIVK
jgi:FKBP-type peptidyl-prolyl cis-trans isomerase FklB